MAHSCTWNGLATRKLPAQPAASSCRKQASSQSAAAGATQCRASPATSNRSLTSMVGVCSASAACMTPSSVHRADLNAPPRAHRSAKRRSLLCTAWHSAQVPRPLFAPWQRRTRCATRAHLQSMRAVSGSSGTCPDRVGYGARYTNWQEKEMVKSCAVGSAPASCTLTPNSSWKMLYCGPAVSTCARRARRVRHPPPAPGGAAAQCRMATRFCAWSPRLPSRHRAHAPFSALTSCFGV